MHNVSKILSIGLFALALAGCKDKDTDSAASNAPMWC